MKEEVYVRNLIIINVSLFTKFTLKFINTVSKVALKTNLLNKL